MISLVSRKASGGASLPVSTSVKLNKPAKPAPAGRERLKHFDRELAAANQAAVEIEERIHRLETIIKDADSAHERLQIAILVDNGASLASYSSGQVADNSEIGKLVIAADTTARSATAAKAALPTAQASLASCHEQAIALNAARVAELDRVMASLADNWAREYQAAFDTMVKCHDRLVGFSNVQQSNLGDIRLIEAPIAAPRFALPSMGHPDADPFLRAAFPSELTVAASERLWRSVKERLATDSDADISDLI